MKELLKNKKAITLIALVITIIVLLILAGVTVATLTGENGLLSKAQLAKEKNIEAEKDEKDKLENYQNAIDEYFSGERNVTSSSTIINNFNIETIKVTGTYIKVKTSNIQTTNNSNVIGYIWFCNNKAIGISETNEYMINGLNLTTTYNGIYVAAIDETGALKKSSNELEETTTTTFEVYNATIQNKNIFSSNHSDGSAANYKINNNGVLEIYGDYCNRNLGAFEVDLTNYNSAVIEWYNQNIVDTLGCVITTSNTGFGVDDDIAYSNGIVKYAYNTSTSSFITTTFDVSNLTGKHYIGIFGFEEGFYGYIKSITLY